MEHYLTNSQPWVSLCSSDLTHNLLIPFLGEVRTRTRRYLTVLKSESRCVNRNTICSHLPLRSLKNARSTRSKLTLTSVLTWRSGIHLHDAYATPLVVPNEVANQWQMQVTHARVAHIYMRTSGLRARPRHSHAFDDSIRPGCLRCRCLFGYGYVLIQTYITCRKHA